MYRVELDGVALGETSLEWADPPMGVVFGKVRFSAIESPYDLFKTYCSVNGIPINSDDEETGFIETQNIPGLKVFRSDGVEIAGIPGSSISGFRDEGYSVTILGIPYPFYQEEFPHHTEAYEKRFGGDDTNDKG